MASGTIKQPTHYGTREKVTLPFTAPCDGTMTAFVLANTTASMYAKFTIGSSSESGSEKLRHGVWIFGVNGGTMTNSAPIHKGETMALDSSSNVKESHIYFNPLVG